MPEQEGKPAEGGDTDKNLKAEMDRKLNNIATAQSEKIESLVQGNQALSDQIKQLAEIASQQQYSKQEESFDDLKYTDPDAFARRVEEKVRAESDGRIRAIDDKMRAYEEAQIRQEKQNRVVAQIAADFPEVNDPTHPLTQRAVELYQEMNEDDKNFLLKIVFPLSGLSQIKISLIYLIASSSLINCYEGRRKNFVYYHNYSCFTSPLFTFPLWTIFYL